MYPNRRRCSGSKPAPPTTRQEEAMRPRGASVPSVETRCRRTGNQRSPHGITTCGASPGKGRVESAQERRQALHDPVIEVVRQLVVVPEVEGLEEQQADPGEGRCRMNFILHGTRTRRIAWARASAR